MSEPDNKPNTDKKPISNLALRVISAVILLPVVLGIIFFGDHWTWAAFCFVLAFAGGLEFMKITSVQESLGTRVFSVVLALIPATLAYFVAGDEMSGVPYFSDHSWLLMGGSIAATVWGAFLFNSFRPREISRASNVISATIACAGYVGGTVLFLALFKRDLFEFGNAWLFTLMAMTWGSDTGAYFTGRAFGKHKMAPILSPKKSIEGAVGGFASALIAAFIARAIAFPHLSVWQIVLLAVVANFLAQTGDLAESLLKRSFGVKDSGKTIPGHGGVLDRVDALIFSAPWVYIFAILTMP